MKSRKTAFIELKEVFDILHGPRGCLWDKEQTFDTLIPQFKEESGELVSAVRKGDKEHIKEELGDVLLHVMFYSQIAGKEGFFDIEDVVKGLISKLKRRHPHVFGGRKVSSAGQIVRNWEKIKKQEKKR